MTLHSNHNFFRRNVKVAIFAAYVGSIIAANYLTEHFGLVAFIGLTFTAGTALAGACLVFRDGIQTLTGNRLITLAAILIGTILTYFITTPFLALASGLAFLVSELVDMAVYTPVAKRNIPVAVLAASIVASPIDTVLFLHLAGFPVTVTNVLTQWLVKTAVAVVAVLFIRWYRTWFVR
jgi:queuosine precursor transporter